VRVLFKELALAGRDARLYIAVRLHARTRKATEDGPMTTFDERRNAYESKFAHDEDRRFKVTARRNKLLGLWVAERLGKSGADAEAYARTVILADFEEAGDADVLRKVQADLKAAGQEVAESELRTRMDAFAALANDDLKDGR
jgi:hypothetical protein